GAATASAQPKKASTPASQFIKRGRAACKSEFRPARSDLAVDLGALLDELNRLDLHALLEGLGLVQAFLGGVLAHVLGDLHRAEVRAAHRAEVRDLGRLLGQRLVVEGFRLVVVEAAAEMVVPAELEERLATWGIAGRRA